MIAALMLVAAGAAPILGMSEAQLDQAIAQAHKLPMDQRIEELSKLFIGVDYGEFPLGEGGTGPEPQARFRTDKVDCQTYIETVLAFANARSLPEARAVLDDLRYSQGVSFETRNHFTEAQWLPVNARKGYLRDEVPAVDAHAPAETLTLVKSQWRKVPALKRLATADVPDGKYTVRYLPLEEVEKRAASIAPGSILFVVREHDPNRVVRITHMGFVVRGATGLVVRNAALGPPHAVTDEPLHAFVERQAAFRKWKVVGFALAKPLDASARVRELHAAR